MRSLNLHHTNHSYVDDRWELCLDPNAQLLRLPDDCKVAEKFSRRRRNPRQLTLPVSWNAAPFVNIDNQITLEPSILREQFFTEAPFDWENLSSARIRQAIGPYAGYRVRRSIRRSIQREN